MKRKYAWSVYFHTAKGTEGMCVVAAEDAGQALDLFLDDWKDVRGDRIIGAKCKLWQPIDQLRWEGIEA